MFVTTSNAVPGGCCRAPIFGWSKMVMFWNTALATDGPVDNESLFSSMRLGNTAFYWKPRSTQITYCL